MRIHKIIDVQTGRETTVEMEKEEIQQPETITIDFKEIKSKMEAIQELQSELSQLKSKLQPQQQ